MSKEPGTPSQNPGPLAENSNTERPPSESELTHIINSFKPKTPGLRFNYEGRGLSAHAWMLVPFSDEELFQRGIEHYHLDPLTLNGYPREEVISSMREEIGGDKIGGLGVTGRSLQEIIDTLSGSEAYFQQPTGKIVFIGNGFSSAPLEMMRRAHEPFEIVVDDVLDYERVAADLEQLVQEFSDKNLIAPVELSESAISMRALSDAIRSGKIHAETYRIGDGRLPEHLADASLVINSYGPGEDTIEEQLNMLAPGGVLVTYQTAPFTRSNEFQLEQRLGENGAAIRRLVK